MAVPSVRFRAPDLQSILDAQAIIMNCPPGCSLKIFGGQHALFRVHAVKEFI